MPILLWPSQCWMTLRSHLGVCKNRGLGMTQVVEPDAGDASLLGDAVEFPLGHAYHHRT